LIGWKFDLGRTFKHAGAGGNVATRPDSRDSPHLFGLGIKEMLADEITTDLRNTRALAITQAQQRKLSVTLKLVSKGVQLTLVRTYMNRPKE